MQKLTLDLDTLQVSTFTTTEELVTVKDITRTLETYTCTSPFEPY